MSTDVYYYKLGSKLPKQMVREFIEFLVRMNTQYGAKIVTMNGTRFDFRLLAEESGWHDICAKLALQSYDPCLQAVCNYGYPVGLQAFAHGFHLGYKTKLNEDDTGGLSFPALWQKKDPQCLSYSMQDSSLTKDVVLEMLEQKRWQWVNRKGRNFIKRIPYLLSAEACLMLPQREPAWPDSPWLAERFADWMLK